MRDCTRDQTGSIQHRLQQARSLAEGLAGKPPQRAPHIINQAVD